MKLRLPFLFFLFSFLALAQKPAPSDKAYIFQDSLLVLGTDYVLKSSLENPNDFRTIRPTSSFKGAIKSLSLIAYKKEALLVNAATNAVYKFKEGRISSWVPAVKSPHIGATYLVQNDTLFRYGGAMDQMNIDFFSFLNEATAAWEPYPAYHTKYTPNGSFNNCYVRSEDAVVFMRGARVNRRNLSDEYLDDHIISYQWSTGIWKELGHTRADYKDFHSSVAMGAELLFYNEKSMYHVAPFENSNTLYYRGLRHQNLNKNDALDALFYRGNFYCLMNLEGAIEVMTIPKDVFLATSEGLDAFYDPPSSSSKAPYYALGGLLLLLAFYKPIKKALIKDKISLELGGVRYGDLLHPIEKNAYNLLELLLSKPQVTTSELMSVIENQRISYSQNMKIKNQLIENLNIVLKTILGISTNVIVDVKDKTDQRVTLYELDKQYFKH